MEHATAFPPTRNTGVDCNVATATRNVTSAALECRAQAGVDGCPAPFGNVVVSVDGMAAGRDAIALATRLCAERGHLTLAHVMVHRGPRPRSLQGAAESAEASAMLERERAASGAAAELCVVGSRSVGAGLRQLAEEREADLLVVGSSARGGLGRLLCGDDTRDSLTGAPCAVAVAPHGYREQQHGLAVIGVGYDATPESQAALSAARGLAVRHRSRIRALTLLWPSAWGAAAEPRWAMALGALEEAARRRLRSFYDVEGEVKMGPPGQELVALGGQVDLLVVGSRGHGPLRRLLLGSTSAYLARSASCPLLICPRTSLGDSRA